MNKRFLKPVAATAVAATALVAYALTPSAVAAAPDLRVVFEHLDGNHDGAISAAEFVDRRELGPVLMRRGDTGKRSSEGGGAFMLPLHPGEPLPVPGADLSGMLRHAFAEEDSDRNGAVTYGEFESHHLAMYRQGFEGIDADRDGAIEPAEYDAAVRKAPGWPAPQILPFEHADDDNDGRITWQEFFG